MALRFTALAQSCRDAAARLRVEADRMDGQAQIADGFADAVAREAERCRTIQRALLEDGRREGDYFDRRQH